MSDLNSSLSTLFNKMESFVSSKTVVGEPINIDNVIIVPLVDISVGIGAGSSEKKGVSSENSGGGLGARITPSAMLVIQGGAVQLVDVKGKDSLNKLIDMVPGIVSKFDFPFFKGKNSEDTEDTEDIENEDN